MALSRFSTSKGLQATVLLASNLGDSTDTTAAIYRQIARGYHRAWGAMPTRSPASARAMSSPSWRICSELLRQGDAGFHPVGAIALAQRTIIQLPASEVPVSSRVNGIGDRVRHLQQARRGGARHQQPSNTPAEELGMIDRVIASYGLDPRKSTDPQGWRRLSLGSAECRAGVIRWSPTERYLVVFSPLLRLPTKSRQLGRPYRLLLELNHEATQGARFSIRGEVLFVSITRPIRGLDEVEVQDAILSVLTFADLYDDRLEEFLGRLPPAMAQLPDIKLRPRQALAIGARWPTPTRTPSLSSAP